MKNFISQPIVKFLLIFAGLYVLWFLVYDLWLHRAGTLDETVVLWSMIVSQDILEILGYTVYTDGVRTIWIEGSSGLWIGDSCNAVVLVALYAGFIIAFPGKILPKLLFLFLGALAILLLNVLRIVALAIIDIYSRTWTEFNHSYTFTILMYGFIFFIWYLWVKKNTRQISANESQPEN